jgi:carbon monoxide dehydrogenase subunit G
LAVSAALLATSPDSTQENTRQHTAWTI